MLATLALALAPAMIGDAPADPRLAGYRTPAGWKVELAATEPMVVNPVTMAWMPDNRLMVVEWVAGGGPNDHIKILSDDDGDGTLDRASTYMDNLELPAGLAFWDGWTYISLGKEVVRFHDPDLDGKYDKREVVASGFGNDNSHHRVSGLTIGPDGWLYITTGDSDAHALGSDGSKADVLRCGGVFRCLPDGKKLECVAFGMRNPWGNVAFDDEFRIFHTDNDNEGANGFTGCRLLHVVDGGDYGWRLRMGARCCEPDYERATWNGGRPGRLGWIAETGRGAPAGLCVLNSAAFPPSTRNLLVYPDVFRKLVRAYTLKPAGATFLVDKEYELLASDEGLFRPTDAEIGPDGALYILDWRTDSGGAGKLEGNGTTGRIYRMTWSGTDAEPARPTLPRDRLTKLIAGPLGDLWSSLGADDYATRRLSALELIRRRPTVDQFLRLFLDRNHFDYFGHLHALLVRASLGQGVMVSPLIGVKEDLEDPEKLAQFNRRNASRSVVQLDSEAWSLPVDDSKSAARILHESGILARGLFEAATKKRASALALGHFSGIRRRAAGEAIDSNAFLAVYNQKLNAIAIGAIDGGPGSSAQRSNLEIGRLSDLVSTDLIADRLLVMAGDNRSGDPFLRDAFTRGLERIGQAGIEAVVAGIGSADLGRSEAALYALQGWRSADGLDALIAEATTGSEIPTPARVNLFRALREMGDAVPPGPIAKWLGEATGADGPARAEAVRVLAAMRERAVGAASPILATLLVDPSDDVRRFALSLARSVRTVEAKAALVEVMTSPNRSPEDRRLAVSALAGYEDKGLARVFESRYGRETDAAVIGELLRALAPLDFKGATTQATGLLESPDPVLRGEAIALLGQKPESALIAAKLYNDGVLPRQDLARVIEAIRPHRTPELTAANQDLLRKTILAAPSSSEAGKLREFVDKKGDAGRGKSIFFEAAKGNCGSCHRIEGQGGSIGPDLTRVWQTLSFEKRAESILEPSKEIKEGYATYKVAAKDGRILTGLLVSKGDDGVTLRDAQGREVKVPAAEIEESATDPVSLMPAGVVGHLSLDELADLLAFLGSQAAQDALKGAK